MTKNIKEIIKNQKYDSEYEPDSEFLLNLRNQIINISKGNKMENIKDTSIKNKFRFPFLRYAFLTSLVVLVGAGLYVLVNPESRPTMSVAYAMEKIKYSYDQLVKEDSIFHQKTVLKWYEYTYDGSLHEKQDDISYEIWEDMSSNRMRNIATYDDDTVYQIHDGDKYWNYSVKDNKVIVETYIYSDASKKDVKLGDRMLGSLSNYQELFGKNEADLVLGEETIDGEKYIVLTSRTQEDIDATLELKPETDVNKYYFDAETFLLRRDRYYKVTAQDMQLAMETVIEELESFERTPERMAALFTFELPLSADVIIEERDVFIDDGGIDDSVVIDPDTQIDVDTDDSNDQDAQEIPAPDVTPVNGSMIDDINAAGFYENDEFKVVIPAGWTAINVKMSDSGDDVIKGIVIEKDGYYLDIMSDVLITGGGFGYPYDGVCESNKSYLPGLLLNGDYERIDVTMSMNIADGCTLNDMNIVNTQESPFWVGSVIKLEGSDYPIISRSEMFGEDYDYDDDNIIIRYGYDYWNDGLAGFEFPELSSQKLNFMMVELDEITNSIEFYK